MKKLLYLTIKRENPSTRLRVLDHLDFLRERLDVRLYPLGSDVLSRTAMLAEVGKADIVVLQKKLLRPVEIILIKSLNSNFVYDYDDAVMFHEIERNKPLTGDFFKTFCFITLRAKAVIAGSRTLAGFSLPNNRNTHVLPTPVDVTGFMPRDYPVDSKNSDGKVVIGWIGTKGNLRYLDVVATALARISKKYPEVEVRIICDQPAELPGARSSFRKWSLANEADELRGLDIGIMPLTYDIWTMGKCSFKILQYFCAGVPAIATPVGMNSEVISHGDNGFLADTEDDWFDYLSVLIDDRELRREMGMRGRALVEEKYSKESYREALAGLLDKL